jgi:hypothetical protein
VGVGVDAGAGVATTGTVTSVLAAGLEAVFLTAGMLFALTVDFAGGISNAWYTTYTPYLFKSHSEEGAHQNKTKMVRLVHCI